MSLWCTAMKQDTIDFKVFLQPGALPLGETPAEILKGKKTDAKMTLDRDDFVTVDN